MRAINTTTLITHKSGWTSGVEVFGADSALLHGCLVRVPAPFDEIRVLTPEFGVRSTMARGAKCNQVPKFVCRLVRIKQMKRADMVNLQRCSVGPTRLTLVVVPREGGFSLGVPVGPTVGDVSAEPRGVVSTAPSIGRAPLGPACTVTEVVLLHCVRLPFKLCFACCASDRNALPPLPLSVGLLPFPVALEPAEGLFCDPDVVRTPFHLNPT